MGPDEYHDRYPGADRPGLDNNAYTNVMAVWVLCRAMDVLGLLPADERQRLVEIDSLSVSPDTFLRVKRHVAAAEGAGAPARERG